MTRAPSGESLRRSLQDSAQMTLLREVVVDPVALSDERGGPRLRPDAVLGATARALGAFPSFAVPEPPGDVVLGLIRTDEATGHRVRAGSRHDRRTGERLPDGGADARPNFTVIDFSQQGTDAATPIIELPNVAALGFGRAVPCPVPAGPTSSGGTTTWGLGHRIWLSLSFDHMIHNGEQAGRFLAAVAEGLQA